jgi:hypothetical protein
MMLQSAAIGTPLKRIAVFFDGSFFQRVNQYYAYTHPRKQFINILGLLEYLRHRVAGFETGSNVSLCQIVEAHYFRGRFSLAAAKEHGALETDRKARHRRRRSTSGSPWRLTICRYTSALTCWCSSLAIKTYCHWSER